MLLWASRLQYCSLPPCRLVGGLPSEKVRWAKFIEKFKQEAMTLAGDVLLMSSYLHTSVGCFGRNYRTDLLETKWMEYIQVLCCVVLCEVSRVK